MRVVAMPAHGQLDGVGDGLARGERRAHALVAHGDAVGDGDGGELARRAERLLDAELHRLRLAVQRDVAGRGLVPAGGDADERLVDLGLDEAHGVEVAAVRRALRALGDVAAGQPALVELRRVHGLPPGFSWFAPHRRGLAESQARAPAAGSRPSLHSRGPVLSRAEPRRPQDGPHELDLQLRPARRSTRCSRGARCPENLWVKCDECGTMLFHRELADIAASLHQLRPPHADQPARALRGAVRRRRLRRGPGAEAARPTRSASATRRNTSTACARRARRPARKRRCWSPRARSAG